MPENFKTIAENLVNAGEIESADTLIDGVPIIDALLNNPEIQDYLNEEVPFSKRSGDWPLPTVPPLSRLPEMSDLIFDYSL